MKRKIVGGIIRLALTAGFIALLFKLVDVPKAVATWRKSDPVWVAGMAALLMVCIPDMAIRWWLILRASNIQARLAGVFSVTYTGYFFNNFLPGGAGGDIARAVIVAKETDRKAAVLGTVIFDRLIVLGTLMTIGLAAAASQFSRPEFRQPTLMLSALVGGGALAALIYFSPIVNRVWLREKWPVIANVDEVLTLVRRRPMLVVAGVGLSIFGQGLGIFAFYGVAQALHFSSVTFGQALALVPIYAVVNALPISIGGLGPGEIAASYLFGLMGLAKDDAVSVALLYRACMIVTSLPGAAIFMLGKARAH